MASRVKGLKEARWALKQLPEKVERRVLRSATRSGGAVLRRAVRSAAPIGEEPSEASAKYGRLRENIRLIRLKRNIPKGSAIYRVDTGKAFWGYLLERGTRWITAQPWFRPAVAASWPRAVNTIKERLAQGVAREAEKLGRRWRF